MTEDQAKLPQFTHGIAVMNAGKPLANLKGDATSILARLQSETAIQVAEDLGITTVSLYQWLLRNAPEEWQALSSAVQLDKLHTCQDTFDREDCDSAMTSRVREKARIAMWQLSKTSKLYADKQESAGMNVQVIINRDEPAEVRVVSDSDT